MAYKKLADLVLKLENRTQEGLVDWKETAKPNTFHADFGNYYIIITQQQNIKSEGYGYFLTVFNNGEQQIESFSDDSLSEFRHPYGSYHASMGNIHETARRIALGSEHAINAILSVLDDDTTLRKTNGAGGRT